MALAGAAAAAIGGLCVSGVLAQARKPPAKRPAAPAARPAAPKPTPAKPPAGAPAPAAAPAPAPQPAPKPAMITAAALGPALKEHGFEPEARGEFQRVRIEEEEFDYAIDFSITRSGEWLIGVAHLAPIPDLTRVPSAPLLSLLSANDSLLGMYFSYDRERSQIVLNATVPARATRPEDLKGIIEGMRATIRQTQGLWDPSAW
jgi:hypothetical protein